MNSVGTSTRLRSSVKSTTSCCALVTVEGKHVHPWDSNSHRPGAPGPKVVENKSPAEPVGEYPGVHEIPSANPAPRSSPTVHTTRRSHQMKTTDTDGKPTIVLVHGAWADGKTPVIACR